MDVSVSAVALVVTLPVQAAVAALVATRLGRPVLFRQPRPGLNGKVFTLVKFRTMLSEDASRGLVTDEQRLTRFGRALRATSLDELPTLWNVLRGDMSLVGPRPLRVEYLSRYDAEQMHRHDVRPGVTGLAQVSGRNSISWDEKFTYDLRYVRDLSLRLDLRILRQTFAQVFSGKGVSQAGHVTMPEFMPE
ncbi:MAG: sugar transferase [Propionibacteriaceae bacterium]|nr:sugar transferase [Propionibacteriaceae bacterium]